MSEGVSGAASKPPVVQPNRYLLGLAPPVAPEFWGEITYRYQSGKMVGAEVKEALKP